VDRDTPPTVVQAVAWHRLRPFSALTDNYVYSDHSTRLAAFNAIAVNTDLTSALALPTQPANVPMGWHARCSTLNICVSHSASIMLKILLGLFTLLVFGDPSWAQSNEAVKKCVSETEGSHFDSVIDGCTGAIESAQLSDENLASAFNTRGFIYYKKKEYDRAIQDYDRAISLRPNDGAALLGRANAYQEKRLYDRALVDYEAVAQIDPSFASDRFKGFLFFYLGQMTQSVEMFEKHIKSDPSDVWVMLFHYLADAKIGSALVAARELEAQAARLKERSWPAPVIDFHLGKIDEKAMFAAADDPDPKIRNEKTCVANFHAAEARLFRAYISGAIPLLRTAAKECPAELYESHGASTELQRLGQK
jgi:lipoprotein NlpI